MQVNVSARHGHLKQHDQQIIVEKADKLRRFFDRINSIEVTIDLEHLDKPTAEIFVSAEGSNDFVATNSGPTVIVAFEGCLQKVEQQVRKHKEKVTGHKATGHKHIEPPANADD
jgi:putative sigma-54 modulation protein